MTLERDRPTPGSAPDVLRRMPEWLVRSPSKAAGRYGSGRVAGRAQRSRSLGRQLEKRRRGTVNPQ